MRRLPPGADVLRLPTAVQKAILHDGKDYLAVKEVYVIVNQPIPGERGIGEVAADIDAALTHVAVRSR